MMVTMESLSLTGILCFNKVCECRPFRPKADDGLEVKEDHQNHELHHVQEASHTTICSLPTTTQSPPGYSGLETINDNHVDS
jgi:hypothetical protein